MPGVHQMKRYSAFAVAREALRFHTGWERAWRSPEPRRRYDVVIVGAGGHGLATAYYLGKNFGITNVAVIEKGWLGGGNTGRNTTIIRSNYLQDPSAAIYEKARGLYETLSQDLNYNVMFSPRGVMMLAQTQHEIRGYQRTAHANALQGVETRFITPAEVKVEETDGQRRAEGPGAAGKGIAGKDGLRLHAFLGALEFGRGNAAFKQLGQFFLDFTLQGFHADAGLRRGV